MKKPMFDKDTQKKHSDNGIELSLKYLDRTLWPCLFEKEIKRERTACLQRGTSGNSDWRTQTDKKRGKKCSSEIVGNCVTRTHIHVTHTHRHARAWRRTHAYTHTRGIRDSAIMRYGVEGRYGRMAFLIKTIRILIALGFHLILRH